MSCNNTFYSLPYYIQFCIFMFCLYILVNFQGWKHNTGKANSRISVHKGFNLFSFFPLFFVFFFFFLTLILPDRNLSLKLTYLLSSPIYIQLFSLQVCYCIELEMMMMEDQEEVVVCKDQVQIIKGKRTKRPRPLSPLTLAMASSTTSSGGESGGEGGRNSDDSRGFDRAVASTTTSVELAESTEEEEDMANCLILLAQGQTGKPSEPTSSSATTSKTGIYVHQCKTCNRCFPSFQALGGHRASHKKPKVHNEENNKGLIFVKEDNDQFNNMNTTLSLQITHRAVLCNSSKSKVHECSICGAEFSSGQALGGHMRRHRTLTNAAITATTTLSVGTRSSPESEESKKPRTVLQLDLNLPAPEDDHHRESKLSFASKEKLLAFSASNLVDCHY
ncbi:zinc finger protein ZAT5-like [Durio zibethinus]|uniref:Zinc finger protein ZAT5-like n=1 Tax=Durio zibethinus TaxID=66656 RepID=A0A6P5YVJ0_DURZI|nr:zinc finger protein ZAT5-like [Durio zibethinus]